MKLDTGEHYRTSHSVEQTSNDLRTIIIQINKRKYMDDYFVQIQNLHKLLKWVQVDTCALMREVLNSPTSSWLLDSYVCRLRIINVHSTSKHIILNQYNNIKITQTVLKKNDNTVLRTDVWLNKIGAPQYLQLFHYLSVWIPGWTSCTRDCNFYHLRLQLT